MEQINLFIYSYKNKNLPRVVESIFKNTSSNFHLTIKDQHPIDRKNLFADDRITYLHEFWDHLYSPLLFKKEFAHKSTLDYYGIISDDILLSKDWDEVAISLCTDKQIVSGMGSYKIDQSDKFLIQTKRTPGPSSISNLVDRNFVFGKRQVMHDHEYSDYLKYDGEGVAESLAFFLEGISIATLPENTYQHIGFNSLEETYVPFSRQHGYNRLVKILKKEFLLRPFPNTVEGFVDLHGINLDQLLEFPHAYEDVEYDPNDFKIDTENIGGKRFSDRLKAIY